MLITVYLDRKAVGMVKLNTILDTFNEECWSYGGVGSHLGLTKLRMAINGLSYVLIYSSDWAETENYGALVTENVAKQAVLRTGNKDLYTNLFGKAPMLQEHKL